MPSEVPILSRPSPVQLGGTSWHQAWPRRRQASKPGAKLDPVGARLDLLGARLNPVGANVPPARAKLLKSKAKARNWRPKRPRRV